MQVLQVERRTSESDELIDDTNLYQVGLINDENENLDLCHECYQNPHRWGQHYDAYR